jgi:hypothetical protein
MQVHAATSPEEAKLRSEQIKLFKKRSGEGISLNR